MKKIILLSLAAVFALGLNSCKKDDDNGGNNNPTTTCYLKSSKETITKAGQANQYGGFVIYYDGANNITRANFIDSISGNEDSTSYVLLSYNNGYITDTKVYQKGQLFVSISNVINSAGKITQRDMSIDTEVGYATIKQTYTYGANGSITASIRTTTVDNVPTLGKVISKDSALFSNYNSFGRVASITIYNSFSSTLSGPGSYEFSKEIAYEYDSKGNRTKESSKAAITDPFEVDRIAAFDQTKTAGDAETAYRIISRLFAEDWADPNIKSKDFDTNLSASETTYASGTPTSNNTTYTFNDKNSPATSVKTEAGVTTNSVITYFCK